MTAPTADKSVGAANDAGTPPFRRDAVVHGLIAISGLSRAGDAAWLVAVTWTAVHLASPAVAGLVVAAGTIPKAVVLLYGGVLADRVDALRLMRFTNLARAVVLAATAVLAYRGVMSVGLLLVVVVLFGIAEALFRPASTTVPRQLLHTDDLRAFFGLSQTAQRLGQMGGAAAGGVLVAAWGLSGSAAINASTCLLEAGFLLVVTVRFPLERTAPEQVLRSILNGFAHLRREPLTRTVVMTLSGLNLAVSPALSIGVALRAASEGWGAHVVGLADALVALGAMVGSLAMVPYRPRRIGVWGFALLAVQGVAIGLLGLGGQTMLAAGCLAIGLTAGAASASLGALFMATVEESYLGRMSSIQSLGDAVLMPAANAAFGALAAVTATMVPFAIFGGAMALLMARTVSLPVVRRLELSPADPKPAAAE